VDNYLPLVLDVEYTGGLSPSAIADNLYLTLVELESLVDDFLMIYSSPGFMNSYVAVREWMKDYLWWIAHWNVSEPTMPNAVADLAPTFWQYTVCSTCGPDYGAESNGLDLNLYNGTVQQMMDQFRPGEPQDECSRIKSITFIRADGTRQVMTECSEFLQYLIKTGE
jgi:lysozyme